MKFVNIIISAVQVVAVAVYIVFYNAQYIWSLYGAIHNVLASVMK